jgi:glucose-1-phosphate cytidylyltransferase
MKVVLFCGGLGMRLREFSENTPKPMVPIGYRPIIWHLMKYYAHFGYKEFILCLGYRADLIKNYFINYSEWLSNDFVLDGSGRTQMLNTDIHDWKITFCETGVTSNIAQRLTAVREHLNGDEFFMANYADNLSSLHLPNLVEFAMQKRKVACLLSATPAQSFHAVDIDADGRVTGLCINAGFFVLRKDIFDYIRPGDELVHAPFARLIERGELISYKHDGFFASMDTFKERQALEDMFTKGSAPWMVWKTPSVKK